MGPERAAEAQLRYRGTPGAGHYEIATTANFTEPFVLKGSFTLNEKVSTLSSAKQSISLGLALASDPGKVFFSNRYDGRRASFQCGAFTWGVLDRLLEEPWLQIEGVSATSAGAMNAAVLVDGDA